MMWRDGLAILLAAGGVIAAAWLLRHRARRKRHLDQLAGQRSELIRDATIQIAATDVAAPAREFARNHIARIKGFVTPECLRALREEAVSQAPQMKRTFIPLHKKGATLSYEQIHMHAPHCLAFYHSQEVQEWVSRIAGVTVFPTPDQDQSSLSILSYHEPGDHINWHYDHNFYRGRHFTVLLSLVNEGPDGGVSRGTYQRQLPAGKVENYDTSANVLMVFEGSMVRHRASPIGERDRRVILSMTYCADPRISRFREFIRRCKDTAFFGLRALWD